MARSTSIQGPARAFTAPTRRRRAGALTPAGSSSQETTTSEGFLLDQASRTGLSYCHSTAGVAVVAAARLALPDLDQHVADDLAHPVDRRVVPSAQVSENAHVFRLTWNVVACATGRTTISSMSTGCGLVTANTTHSATSTGRRAYPFHMPTPSSSSARSSGSRPTAPPALLTSPWTRPYRLRTSPTKRSTLSLSVTSSSRASPEVPSTFFTRSTRRAPPTTVYPCFARARALAAPMPDDAPVTTAIGLLVAAILPRSVP